MSTKQSSKLPKEDVENLKLRAIDDDDPTAEYEYVVEPPDGGFGWVIAIAALVCISKDLREIIFDFVYNSSCAI